MTFIIAVPQPLDGMVSLDILLRHFEKTDPVIYKTAVSYHKKHTIKINNINIV